MVFQSYALYPHKTVQANIEFPLKVRGESKVDRAAQGQVGSRGVGTQRVSRSQAGSAQRRPTSTCRLARAIVRQPAVFCMDEPLSNLDAKLRGETRAELVDLHRRLDATILYVTHDQVEAMTMGTRVAVMSHGHLQQIGTPQEVYAKPETVFVATFIGTPPMNVMPVGLFERSDVLVGVRPEHLRAQRRWRWARVPRPNGRATRPRDAADLRRGRYPHRRSSGCRGRRYRRSATTSRLDAAEAHRHRFDPVRPEREDRRMRTQVARLPGRGRHVAAVGGDPRCVRRLPVGPRGPARPPALRCNRHDGAAKAAGSVRRRVPQQRVPARAGQHDTARAHDRADRSRARHRLGGAGRQADPRRRHSFARCSRRRSPRASPWPAWCGSCCCNPRSVCCPICSTGSSRR